MSDYAFRGQLTQRDQTEVITYSYLWNPQTNNMFSLL